MLRPVNSIILLLMIGTCQAHLVVPRHELPRDEPTQAALQFSLDLLNKITQGNTDNVVYSPWSLFSTLSMLHLGLSDESTSQDELNRVLGMKPEAKEARHEAMRRLYQEMSTGTATDPASSALKFIQANKVLFNKNIVKLNPGYAESLAGHYDASIEPFVLGEPNEPPVEVRVNNWVKNATYGTIEEIADSSLSSNPDLALVLLNAAYFKGTWLHVFSNTKVSRFYNQGKHEKATDAVYMDMKGNRDRLFDYAEFGFDADTETAKSEEEKKLFELTKDLNCSVLALPYNLNNGKDYSMVIILPNELDGIDYVQSKLNPQVLNAMFKSMKKTMLNIGLPKLEFETNLQIPSYLKAMNLTSIFQASHDFKEMFTSDKPFAVDKITHKSKIKIDEKGTEAAGATMMTIFKKTASPGHNFVANHPFIFVIRHNKSNMPLFMGRVNTVKETHLDPFGPM